MGVFTSGGDAQGSSTVLLCTYASFLYIASIVCVCVYLCMSYPRFCLVDQSSRQCSVFDACNNNESMCSDGDSAG